MLSPTPAAGAPELLQQLVKDGFVIVPTCLDAATVADLCTVFPDSSHPQRNILRLPSVQRLARSEAVRQLVTTMLGPRCFAVRGIFFNKPPTANWKVPWHQDLTIAVQKRRDVPGFGPWTTKEGVAHVQPPAEILRTMLAVRLHLDTNGPDNGPLRVLAGTHVSGRLGATEITAASKAREVTCLVPQGGALVLRPLLLHASSACQEARPRRVIHLEFAISGLPAGLEWQDHLEI